MTNQKAAGCAQRIRSVTPSHDPRTNDDFDPTRPLVCHGSFKPHIELPFQIYNARAEISTYSRAAPAIKAGLRCRYAKLKRRRQMRGRFVCTLDAAYCDCVAICRNACSYTSGGWPPEIKCWSLMMTAGTALMPFLIQNCSASRTSRV